MWVGLTHHFSYLMQSPSSENSVFDTSDLATRAWSESAGKVVERGKMAEEWLSLVTSTTSGIRFYDQEIGGVPAEASSTYPCDPYLYEPAFFASNCGYAYAEAGGGAPTPICFSTPDAYTTGTDEMTSFLGTDLWGEVCFALHPAPYDAAALAAEAFDILFGPHVCVTHEIVFTPFSNQTENIDAQQVLRRAWRLTARDLQTTDDMRATMTRLRTTPENRWLLREFDSGRLVDVVDAAMDADEACPCQPYA